MMIARIPSNLWHIQMLYQLINSFDRKKEKEIYDFFYCCVNVEVAVNRVQM